MRTSLALAALLASIGSPAFAATTISKPPNAGSTASPLSPDGGSYVYANSFVAVGPTARPLTLGAWLAEQVAPAPSLRFEIWGEAEGGGPDAAQVLAATDSIAPAVTASPSYVDALVTSWSAGLVGGERYWFVATVVGETGTGELAVARHVQNSVYADDGTFWVSDDPAGELFAGQNQTPEMAFRIEFSPNILILDPPGCVTSGYLFAAVTERWDFWHVFELADDFAEELVAGGTAWDLVLVDPRETLLTAAAEAALIDHVAAGGRLAISYAAINASPSLAAALDASAAATGFTFPRTIHVWRPTAPIVLTPNALPGPLSPAASSCGQEGTVLEATPLGRAIAGFAASPTSSETAIVVGNGGRTVLVSEILGLFSNDGNANGQADGRDLAENIVDRLIQTIHVDDFESTTFCAWSAPLCDS